MSKSSARYIVDDVDAAVAFYRDLLGFEVEMRPAPGFAALTIFFAGLADRLHAGTPTNDAAGSSSWTTTF